MDTEQLRNIFEDFFRDEPMNRMPDSEGGFRLYARAVVTVAAAADPLFLELKKAEAVGPHFLPPDQWLPSARSVVSVFFPLTEEVCRSNEAGSEPSPAWLRARFEGGDRVLPAAVTLALAALRKEGCRALAPTLDSRFVSGRFTSNWSERHVAFVAGQGTFGLSKSLITPYGAAGRLASFIIDQAWPVTPRLYAGLYDYCRHCGVCIERCPAGAIDAERGKDHQPCAGFLDRVMAKYAPRYGCGKCQWAGCRVG